uniref:DUF243 domain-containing protein n=1 Tax=Bactrocera dorsalis TaxID=27457 RepID=A0A034W2J5_BACDO
MFHYCVCLSLLVIASAQDVGYNYASASVPEPQVLLAPPEPAAAPEYVSTPVAAATQQHIQQAAPATVYRKEFYIFTAPAESVVHQSVVPAAQPAPIVKKHLNVVLIKAPESGKSRYQPLHTSVPHVTEESRTQIYVLNKEPSRQAIRPAASQQHTTTYKTHKPEVHYLKYSTPAEAEQLQQQIVQQYGGGHVIELGGRGAASNVNTQYVAPAASNVNNQYLAPAASNVNNQYLAPAASNVNNQYLAPAVEAAAASVPELTNAYIPPKAFFKH